MRKRYSDDLRPDLPLSFAARISIVTIRCHLLGISMSSTVDTYPVGVYPVHTQFCVYRSACSKYIFMRLIAYFYFITFMVICIVQSDEVKQWENLLVMYQHQIGGHQN